MTPLDTQGASRGLVSRQRFEQERPRPTQSVIVHAPSQTTVGNTATTLYTVPSDKFFVIEELTVTNVSGGAETFYIYLVESAGTAGTTNAVIYAEQIAANNSLRLATLSGLAMNPGATMQAKTSTSAGINITFWGVEVIGI